MAKDRAKRKTQQTTITTASTREVNQHVYSYLDFFLARDKNPNFAVLISGSWGIGKTFLIRRYLDSHFADSEKRYLYVSLYGLATAEEINSAVEEALFPMLANKGVQFAGKLAAAVARKVLVELPKVKYSDLVDQFGNMVIVFDDLERCKLDPAVVLGFINRYVEHDECSVIILANETEIKNPEDYARVKEKVVGKTLAIAPSFGEALSAFIDQIQKPELRDFLLSQRADIEAIYQTSGTENLRSLFQVLLDYERIWDAIDQKFRSNAQAMAAVLRMIAALSFELKSGGIKPDDLIDRQINWLSVFRGNEGNKELTPWQTACRKYPTADLQGGLFSDQILRDILARGEVKGDDINACLALSSFFVGDEEPPWRTLWYAFYRTEEAAAAALEIFEQEFRDRTFTDPGIVLHAFGLKLQFANLGLGAGDRATAYKECHAYLDDLEKAGNLMPLKPGALYSYYSGYQGLGFMERESLDFQELLNAFIERQHKVYRDQMPLSADILLAEMETDPDLFWRRINYNNIGDQLYADVPVFAFCEPITFVDKLLALHPAHQNTIIMAIASRYEHGRLNDTLSDEKPWLQAVCRILAERAEVAPPFTKARIRSELKHYLAPKADIEL